MTATSQKIKLSKDTTEVLKNFSSINNTMGFMPGNSLKIISSSGSIAAVATISEELPVEFSIYEMNRFLNVLALPTLADASLEFDDKKVTIQSNQTKVGYYYSSKKVTDSTVGKTPTYPSADFVTTIDAAMLDGLEKAAAALGHKFLKIVAKDGKGMLIATSPDIDTSNDYVIELADVFAHPLLAEPDLENKILHDESVKTAVPDGEYTVKFESIRIIPGTYRIMISAGRMIGFKNLERPIHYFIGLESAV